MGDSRRTG